MIRQNFKFDQKASGLGGGGGVTSGTLIDGPKICIGEGVASTIYIYIYIYTLEWYLLLYSDRRGVDLIAGWIS